MKTIIQNKLSEIERSHKIKILFACESGSRAWGFPSPDSDYDVRFVYKRPIDAYLSIKEDKDFLNFPLNNELDINGWDLKKTLELISKSNAVPFEWLQSPIIYYEDPIFSSKLFTICNDYFCTRTCIHHYLGIARGAKESINNSEIGIKKLFYILRPLLAALWCLKKGNIAPMDIGTLLQLMPKDLEKYVRAIIEIKASAKERFEFQMDNELIKWIDSTFIECAEATTKIEKRCFDIKTLNNYFIKTITK